ncbi:MAG: HAMP domain-containing histidine kinase, partial [Campylobacteraceae bacterium]|nr:HAMP domain-containing histidine kinase [Campylobacteraceae bacterium]
KHNKLTLEYLENKTEEASNQIKFMSNTITDFSDFLSLKKEKEAFFIVDEIHRVISLIQDSFTFLSIKIEVNCDTNHLLLNYKGELTHVIFNLLNNSKDAFSKKQVKDPTIMINIKKVDSNILIFIEDNAGGVDANIVKKIFQPYFTTKENGLGIGLYMSKKIIEESIFGKLSFKNKEEGAEFCISVPLSF